VTANRVALSAAVLVVTAVSFFWFPGHTYLESDTQIYIPILEHLWDRGAFTADAMASRPHVTYTVYDEVALVLRKVTGLGFEPILLGQEFVYRALGVLGLFLMAAAMGLPAPAAMLAAAIASLGAMVAGPMVLTVEYEPIPRGFALPFVLLAMGMAAHGRWLGASVAASIGFWFHPPTAVAPCWLLAFAALYQRRRRPLLPFVGATVFFLMLVFIPERPPEGQQVFTRIDVALEQIQRYRANYNWVSVWTGIWAGQYLFLFAFVVAALVRIWKSVPGVLRFLLITLPVTGLVSVPASWIFLEQVKWMLIPQFQPARYLLYVTLFAAFLGAVAGAHAALKRRVLEAFGFFVVAFLIPIDAKLFTLMPPERLITAVVLALLATGALALTAKRPKLLAPASALVGLAAFLLIPLYGGKAAAPNPESAEVRALAEWARKKTAGESVFVFANAGRGLEPGVFRARSLRALYVDWKSGGQVNYLKSYGHLWWRRWNEVKQPQPLERYCRSRIDYVVFDKAKAPAGPPVYENSRFAVMGCVSGPE
jgi:hypothetical protein